MSRLTGILLCIALVYIYGTTTSAASLSSILIAVAKALVHFGASWAGQTVGSLQNDGYSITAVLQVENWSRFNLQSPECRLYSGLVSKWPPLSIQPLTKEVMVAHKKNWSAWGSGGTVSWLIADLNRRVYVMWNVPNSYAYYKNKLAVGVSRAGYTGHPDNLFDMMYEGKSSNDIKCSSAQFSKNVSPVTFRDDKIDVTGMMTTSYEASIEIIVSAVLDQDLASKIVEGLKLKMGK